MVLKLKPATNDGLPKIAWNDTPPSPDSIPEKDVPNLPVAPTGWFPATDMKMIGARPLYNDIGLVKCNQCEKPILRSAIAEHTETCNLIKAGLIKKGPKFISSDAQGTKRKAGEDGSSAVPGGGDTPKSKKIKLLPNGQPAPKPKARIKGPTDLDRHCCVINDKGLPCSRSLTCKSHSMGAKRAVQGRSRSYDDLLLDWNRANNPRFVEPVRKETKAERKEKKDREKAERREREKQEARLNPKTEGETSKVPGEKKKKKSSSKKSGSSALTNGVHSKPGDLDDGEDYGNIDSEAEVDALTDSIRRIKGGGGRGLVGTPLAVAYDTSSWFVGRRERLRNCHEFLMNALLPAPGRSSFASSRTQ